jgi:putative transcriptional regulator
MMPQVLDPAWDYCQGHLTFPSDVKEALHVRNDVRELRTAQGISQADLGIGLGVSRQTVIAIERGRYDPSLRLAIKIARYFGRAVEEVFHDDER